MISHELMSRYAFSDDFKWFLKLDEPPEHFMAIPYEEFIEKSKHADYEVCITDFDRRVFAMCELLRLSQTNLPYLIKLATKLEDKCRVAGRTDLIPIIQKSVDKAKEVRDTKKEHNDFHY